MHFIQPVQYYWRLIFSGCAAGSLRRAASQGSVELPCPFLPVGRTNPNGTQAGRTTRSCGSRSACRARLS